MVSVHDAEALGISNGQMLKKVSTRRGEIEIAAFVTKRMQRAWCLFHSISWNLRCFHLTTTATDPHAKIPEFKVAAVRIDQSASVKLRC